MLHSPDGAELWIDSAAISVIKQGAPYHDHVTKGIRSLVFTTTGKTFGVVEPDSDIAQMIKTCHPGTSE
jgi:hypothetical protein